MLTLFKLVLLMSLATLMILSTFAAITKASSLYRQVTETSFTWVSSLQPAELRPTQEPEPLRALQEVIPTL